MKIVTDGVAHHLFLMDQVSNESKTLCGSVLTQSQSWKQINSLEAMNVHGAPISRLAGSTISSGP
jgi:endonuclease III-like uncharacterized protein